MAKGSVVRTNPPMNQGVIQIDGGQDTYNYNVKSGDTLGGYVPKVKDVVTFTIGSGNSVSGIEKFIEPPHNCKLKADPATIPVGGARVIFTYETINGVKVSLAPEPGPVQAPSGQVTVFVKSETKFTLTSEDERGNIETCDVNVFIA